MKGYFTVGRLLKDAATTQVLLNQTNSTDNEFFVNAINLTVYSPDTIFTTETGKTYQVEITEVVPATAAAPAEEAAPIAESTDEVPDQAKVVNIASAGSSTAEKSDAAVTPAPAESKVSDIVDKVKSGIDKAAAAVEEFAPIAEQVLPGEAGAIAKEVAAEAPVVDGVVDEAAAPVEQATSGDIAGAVKTAVNDVDQAVPAAEPWLTELEDIFSIFKSGLTSLIAKKTA